MQYEELLGLVEAVSKSGLSSFEYEESGLKISMKGKKEVQVIKTENAIPQMPLVQAVSAPAAMPAQPVMPATALAAPVETALSENPVEEGKLVTSPLVGTFYVAPAEDADPFVSVGDVVKKGQTLAIVEAMKLMNEIECEFDGQVAEVLVENGQMVEFGQPLFRIK